MTVPAWDLDAPAGQDRLVTGFRPGLILLLAVGLAGLGLGSLAGSVLAPSAAPRLPVTATLNIRDMYVDASLPGPSPTPSEGASPSVGNQVGNEDGNAVVVFRLQVDNPADQPVKMTALLLDGVTRASQRLLLDVQVPGHGWTAVDVSVYPDCALGRKPAEVRAELRMTGPDGSDLDSVRVAPMRSLSRFGGLCSQLNLEWPNGWQTPLRASAARPLGPDLEVTIDDLPGSRLAGALVGDRLLPTVFLGDQLLSSSAQLQPGGETRLRLAGPAPCVRASDGTPVPSNLRVLAQGDRGIQQRLVIVGPVLTRWLRLNCR